MIRLAAITLLTWGPVLAQTPTFRTEVRLVEVYATVLDQRGRHVAGLTREQFRVTENGRPLQIAAFEAQSSELSCAIVLDTTGSMERALPRVKSAVARLIDQMRDGDAVAVYGFTNAVTLLQDFTVDKKAAKQAVWRVRAHGATALFDALAKVSRDLGSRQGKKAIVVFTDGEDNSSVLNLSSAMQRARTVGVPVYSIAQGNALKSSALVRQLEDISEKTGAIAFLVRKNDEIEDVFDVISRDLKHTYLLSCRPGESAEQWRRIQVRVDGLKGAEVRAREGYWAE